MGESTRRAARAGAYRPIDAAWRSLAERAIPLDAPDRQRREMRRAFYAGAQALLVVLARDMSRGAVPTEDDNRKAKAIGDELAAFADDLAAGRA